MSFALGLAVFGGIAVAIIAFGLIQRRCERSTATWPWAKISLDSGEIECVGDSWELAVEYSYAVEGKQYSGTYKSSFGSESEAADLLKSLRDIASISTRDITGCCWPGVISHSGCSGRWYEGLLPCRCPPDRPRQGNKPSEGREWTDRCLRSCLK